MAGDRLQALPRDWDSTRGKEFAAKVASRIGTQVHYPKSSPDGSFFLLAVFRRYTFRLNEDTVSHALSSVLGGTPSSFHVRLASERHFRFSVASKAVGLLVYELRRVITQHFDVYFHLWRDGGSDWQKDLVAWEKEEEEQWTVVASKRSKRQAKQVSFANPLNLCSPKGKFKPVLPALSVKLGAFQCWVSQDSAPSSSLSPTASSSVMVFQGKFFQKCNSAPPAQPPPAEAEKKADRSHIPRKKDLRPGKGLASKARSASARYCPNIQASNLGRDNRVMTHEPIRQRSPPVGCFRCLSLGHFVRDCVNIIRCKECFNYGHIARNCFRRKLQPKRAWQRKLIPQNRDFTPSSIDKRANTLNSSAETHVAPPSTAPSSPADSQQVIPQQDMTIDSTPKLDFSNWQGASASQQVNSAKDPQASVNDDFRSILQQVLNQQPLGITPESQTQVQPDSQAQDMRLHHPEAVPEGADIPNSESTAATPTLQVTKYQNKGSSSNKDKIKDIVYRRKKFFMLKFVHNRFIKRTYQRRNKKKRVKTKGKTPTPLTTKGLRRSTRMHVQHEGHRAPPAQSTTDTHLCSSSQHEGIQQIAAIVGNISVSHADLFTGPAKFPTSKEIEESQTPFPEIPIQAIQQVAVDECGLSPGEVATELLKATASTSAEDATVADG